MDHNKISETRRATIYARATPPGRGGIAVVRVSGPAACDGLQALMAGSAVPVPRLASLRTLRDPADGRVIDHAVVLYFKGPASFTGEDVVEYHLHGGPAVVDALLSVCAALPGFRLAEPGEFTRRAFENGRMDLTGAEAIADLIDAETTLQKDQALAQMGGALRDLYQGWTERLTRTLAHLEASIDFSEEDLPESTIAAVRPALIALKDEMTAHLCDNRRGERLREGIHIAVLGAPNAGKSSLVNALSQREVAIVSPMAGTTRDVIETHLDIGGYPVIVADTAGLRDVDGLDGAGGHEGIEGEGIRRAQARAQAADLKILVYDAMQVGGGNKDKATQKLEDSASLIVYNKTDLASPPEGALGVSARTGQGMAAFATEIVRVIEGLLGNRTAPAPTRLRHRQALQVANQSLSRALTAPLPELMAEDIRLAVRALGRITGRVDVEDILDMIFRDFCIGK